MSGEYCRLLEKGLVFNEGSKFFCITLLYHAKASELTLLTIKVSMVVGIAVNEAVSTYMIIGLHSFDHMHREG